MEISDLVDYRILTLLPFIPASVYAYNRYKNSKLRYQLIEITLDWLTECLSLERIHNPPDQQHLLQRLKTRYKTVYDLFINHTHVFKFDVTKHTMFSMELISDSIDSLSEYPENPGRAYDIRVLTETVSDVVNYMVEKHPREYIKYRLNKE